MNWRAKGIIQKFLSSVPGGTAINSYLQHTVGLLRDFEGNVDSKVVADWLVLLSHMRGLGVRPEKLDYLEVGTGWYPTSSFCFSLAGAQRVKTYDIERLIDEKLTFRMLRRLEHHLPAIAASAQLPLTEVEGSYHRLRQSTTLEELLERARIDYYAPADARCTGLPAHSVDIVFSNSVLEHVPSDEIRQIMQESKRILRPGGLAIHSANCADHYAYFDGRISFINYLTYSEREWKFWNNNLCYQNRLRPQDFFALAESAQLQIVLRRYRARPELLALLPKMRIAPEFSKYSPEQLCSTSVDLVAQC